MAGSEARAPRKLLDAAASLFCEKGYETTSTQDLARALGIRKPTLYHHMASKEDLLFQVMEEAHAQVRGAAIRAVAGAPTSAAKVNALIHAHMTTMLGSRDYHYVMLVEHRSLSPVHREQLRELHKEYGELIKEVLADAQAAGVLRTDIRSSHLAFLLTNLMNWSIFWYRDTGGLSPHHIAALIQTQFLHGAMMESARSARLG
jgi:AcrR family transcriptional regulator